MLDFNEFKVLFDNAEKRRKSASEPTRRRSKSEPFRDSQRSSFSSVNEKFLAMKIEDPFQNI